MVSAVCMPIQKQRIHTIKKKKEREGEGEEERGKGRGKEGKEKGRRRRKGKKPGGSCYGMCFLLCKSIIERSVTN